MATDATYRRAQQRIAELIAELVASGNDRGLQVAVYHRGRLIVEACAGTLDAATNRPVEPDTLFPVFSTGKGVATTAVHLLVQRGTLAYDRAVADYWPEFAAAGKGNIMLRHVLTHAAGLSAVPAGCRAEDLDDWDGMCARLAAQAPAAAPGTELKYHAITYGWLAGETARRVDGRRFAQFVTDEILQPLGTADEMFFGVSDAALPRVATLETPVPFALPAVEDRAIPNIVRPLETWMNKPAAQRACMPASNMVASARAIARHYAALLPGGVDGIDLLTPATRAAALVLHCPDASVPPATLPIRPGLGYMLSGPADDLGAVFGHGGYGGSTGYADLTRQLAVGVAKNTMNAQRSAAELIRRELEGMDF